MRRVPPYGKSDGRGLTATNRLALRAIGIVLAEIDSCVSTDPPAADRLTEDVLALLLGPNGRALLPYASETIARLLTNRQRVALAGTR